MLTIRIIKVTDGRSYTAVSGANGTLVFQFDDDTGDDRRVPILQLGPRLRRGLMLEHVSGEEGLLEGFEDRQGRGPNAFPPEL